MKKMNMIMVALLTALIILSGCGADKTGTVLTAEVPAPSLEGSLVPNDPTQDTVVYLPWSYHHKTTKRYPVVYFLPGFMNEPDWYVNGRYNGFQVQKALDRLIAERKIREMIFVIPNGKNALGGSFYTDSPVTGDWEQFITEDVVGYIDANYRTRAVPESRAVTGLSMGGYGALALVTRRTDLFGMCIALSPGLVDDNGIVQREIFSGEKAITAMTDLKKSLSGLSTEDARAEYLSIARKFVAMGRGDMLIPVAYGSAFAPDADGPVPWFNYPFKRTGGELLVDKDYLAAWDEGYGNWTAKIERDREWIAGVRGIVIDVGIYDNYDFIPAGGRYLATVLEQNGIPVQLNEFDGGHTDSLKQRVEEMMLPWLNENLEF
jgi:S-formylglutathione hydrolase